MECAESDDEEGFRWWLAKAEGPARAVQYTGRKKTENGVTFVDGGYYISLHALLRELGGFRRVLLTPSNLARRYGPRMLIT